MASSGYRAICINLKCKKGRFGLLQEETLPSFCDECGAGVISSCPNPKCNTPISELWDENRADPPNHCKECGEELRRDLKSEEPPAIGAISRFPA
jgi:hypothetical protein